MKKIPSVWARDHSDKRALYINEVTPGCEWVLAGEGIATRKWDGTAVAVIDGELYARYDAKRGKPPPPNGIQCQKPDLVTGHWPHWVPADRPQDKWIREAWATHLATGSVRDGTYECCGPKIGANAEGLEGHFLIRHGTDLIDAPREFHALKAYLAPLNVEGVVFHHPDGRMAKATKAGFRLARRMVATGVAVCT